LFAGPEFRSANTKVMIHFLGRNLIRSEKLYQRSPVVSGTNSQRSLASTAIARQADIRRGGITAATVSRLARDDVARKLGRGLYQLTDAAAAGNHTLAEAAKRVPKGVICLVSALVFHGIADQMPRRAWIVIASKDWKPRITIRRCA
jgi:predicted transcriptional regulator of viral defense system